MVINHKDWILLYPSIMLVSWRCGRLSQLDLRISPPQQFRSVSRMSKIVPIRFGKASHTLQESLLIAAYDGMPVKESPFGGLNETRNIDLLNNNLCDGSCLRAVQAPANQCKHMWSRPDKWNETKQNIEYPSIRIDAHMNGCLLFIPRKIEENKILAYLNFRVVQKIWWYINGIRLIWNRCLNQCWNCSNGKMCQQPDGLRLSNSHGTRRVATYWAHCAFLPTFHTI